MKSRVFNCFRGGLLLLIVLTIALIASQAGARYEKSESADMATEVEYSIDAPATHSVEDSDTKNAPVQ
jgi:hypothetical protein